MEEKKIIRETSSTARDTMRKFHESGAVSELAESLPVQKVAKTNKKAYANARQAKNKVKKAVAKTRVEAKNSTRKAGTQLNKKSGF